MRVISGTARGKKLLPVPGVNTRPTTDRVKESIFSAIQMQVRDATVLDLFAGTGQMGIEALSRGAAHCDFVDHDRTAQEIVRKNIAGARVGERATLHASEAAAFLQKAPQYDIIFLDPPYGGKILNSALELIERFDKLSSNGIIICESSVTDEIVPRFTVFREYRYGTIRVAILHAQHKKDGEI